MAQQPKKQVPAVQKKRDLAIVTDQPAYIKNDVAGRGSENVGADDLVIPRLEIVQAMSPSMKKGEPSYIPGAQQGMLNNSVTRQLYGEQCWVVPVYYTKQWLVWRDRKMAEQLKIGSEGGFFGAFNDEESARKKAESEGGEAKAIIVVDTPQHLCLVMNPETGDVEEIMVSMPRTKAKVSRQWNSLVRLAGGDRFSRVYKIMSKLEKNPKGDFYNYTVEPVGFPPESIYREAEALYKRVASGDKKIVVDVEAEHPVDTDM